MTATFKMLGPSLLCIFFSLYTDMVSLLWLIHILYNFNYSYSTTWSLYIYSITGTDSYILSPDLSAQELVFR